MSKKPYHSPKFTRIETVDAYLKIWASRTSSRPDIRKMTGCGAGPINEAGPVSSLGKHMTPELGQVHDNEPVPAITRQFVDDIDKAVNMLKTVQRKVIFLEYKTHGKQSGKAKRAGFAISQYSTLLRRARLRVAAEIGV